MSELTIPAGHNYHSGYINYDNTTKFKCAYCHNIVELPVSYIKYMVGNKRCCSYNHKMKLIKEEKK